MLCKDGVNIIWAKSDFYPYRSMERGLKDVVSRGKVESMTSPVLTLWTPGFIDQQ